MRTETEIFFEALIKTAYPWDSDPRNSQWTKYQVPALVEGSDGVRRAHQTTGVFADLSKAAGEMTARARVANRIAELKQRAAK
jgi:hypothetical protein